MGSITPDFRFGNFVGSIIQVVLVVLAIVTVLILPIIFFTLFFVPLPVVNGQVLTPYLFFSMVVDPSRTLPIVKFLIHTALFKTLLFPGFAFAGRMAVPAGSSSSILLRWPFDFADRRTGRSARRHYHFSDSPDSRSLRVNLCFFQFLGLTSARFTW